MRKAIIALTLAAVAIPMAPALADPPSWAQANGRRDRDYDRDRGEYRDGDRQWSRDNWNSNWDRRDDRYSERNGRWNGDRYYRNGRYDGRRLSYNDSIYRGRDGRYYCKRENGTTGLIVGGIAGALLGRSIDGGRDRTVGTILGGGGGALLGREIDRGEVRCR